MLKHLAHVCCRVHEDSRSQPINITNSFYHVSGRLCDLRGGSGCSTGDAYCLCQPDNSHTFFFHLTVFVYIFCSKLQNVLLTFPLSPFLWCFLNFSSTWLCKRSCWSKLPEQVVCLETVADQLFWTGILIRPSHLFSTRVSKTVILLLFKVFFLVRALLASS